MIAITMSSIKAVIAVGLLLLVVGIVYVLGYSIGHADGELSAYDYVINRLTYLLKDGDDNVE